jgi:hypothetical protein
MAINMDIERRKGSRTAWITSAKIKYAVILLRPVSYGLSDS